MFRVLFNIQALILLIGAAGMALGGYPLVQTLDPLRDTLAFLALYFGLMGLELLFSRLFPSSFGVVQQLHTQIGRAFRNQQLGYTHALQLGMLSGVAEEVLFRGALQSLLASTLGLGWPSKPPSSPPSTPSPTAAPGATPPLSSSPAWPSAPPTSLPAASSPASWPTTLTTARASTSYSTKRGGSSTARTGRASR